MYGQKLQRNLNPLTEVLACNGANSGINILLQSFINESEEVAYFEPLFPPYQEHIQFSKGISKGIPLKLVNGEWVFDVEIF